uniref:(northern house mosquito) hypothetical protein n=1 Tax=Culex pipiens TaxID=7175 RepID=A0A8D8AD19_CULPI
MRLLTISLLLIHLTLHNCRSAVSRLPSERSPDFPGECFHSSSGLHVPRGRSREISGQCQSVQCTDDYILVFTNCGHVSVGSGCYRTEGEPDRPWPQCCPYVICPN